MAFPICVDCISTLTHGARSSSVLERLEGNEAPQLAEPDSEVKTASGEEAPAGKEEKP